MPRSMAAVLLPLLLLAAASQLGSAAIIELKAELAQQLIARAWREVRELRSIDSVRPWPWADTWPVARLQVPELAIDQYVLAGTSGNALAFGPGWDLAAAAPGEEGTAVIAGHRDTHFAFLQGLRPGASLYLQLSVGERRLYRVQAVQVVDTRSTTLAPSRSGPRRLLLVTCYPFNALHAGGHLRYVVQALALDPPVDRPLVLRPDRAPAHLDGAVAARAGAGRPDMGRRPAPAIKPLTGVYDL